MKEEFGTHSLSVAVKDIKVSKVFYETLGFQALDGLGSVEDKWLIMIKDEVKIGLFQDMFEEKGPCHFCIADPDSNQILFDQHND